MWNDGMSTSKKWTWNDGNPKRKWDTHNLRGWKFDIHMSTYVYIYMCMYIYIMLCILHNNRNDPSFLCGGVNLHHTKSAKTNGASTGSNLVRAATADGLQHLIGAPRQLRWTLLRTGKSCFEKAQHQVNIYIYTIIKHGEKYLLHDFDHLQMDQNSYVKCVK